MAVDPENNKVVGAVLAKDHNLGADIPTLKPLTTLFQEAKKQFLDKNPNFF